MEAVPSRPWQAQHPIPKQFNAYVCTFKGGTTMEDPRPKITIRYDEPKNDDGELLSLQLITETTDVRELVGELFRFLLGCGYSYGSLENYIEEKSCMECKAKENLIQEMERNEELCEKIKELEEERKRSGQSKK
jgi:hypothetical protein